MWAMVLSELERSMTQATFDMWLKRTAVMDVTSDDIWLIEVESIYAKDWLTNRLYDLVLTTLQAVCGINEFETAVKDVSFHVKAGGKAEMDRERPLRTVAVDVQFQDIAT